jgi:hypothetical protein
MTPEAIGAIFAGLTGLIAALAGFTASRGRRITTEQKVTRRRVRKLERAVLAWTEYTFKLELEIARLGGNVPDRPAALLNLFDEDDEDDDKLKGSQHAA